VTAGCEGSPLIGTHLGAEPGSTAEGTAGELRADLVIAADGLWSLARREAGLRPTEYDCPFDVWWFRLSRHDDEGEGMPTPRMRNRRFAVPLPRTGYFQIAYLAPKGADLRTEGIEAFRASVTVMRPVMEKTSAVTPPSSPPCLKAMSPRYEGKPTVLTFC
jgi:2-polyprenyl-6-methoxyphenol hydroxylase-like FAD-dependent oxidoreductase